MSGRAATASARPVDDLLMKSQFMSDVWRALFVVCGMSLLMLGQITGVDQGQCCRAEGVASQPSNPVAGLDRDDKSTGKKIAPDRFHEVDEAAKLMVWLVVVCGLGALVLLGLIVMGARRIRRLTRSPVLKSKYDELEHLRAKYQREVDGLDTPPPPNREPRR